MRTSAGEPPAARWLDSEDATIRLALDWALRYGPDIAVRLVVALCPWWTSRGQLATVLRYCRPPPRMPRRLVTCGARFVWTGKPATPAVISPWPGTHTARSSRPPPIGVRGHCWPTRWPAGQSPRQQQPDRRGPRRCPRAVAVAREVGHQASEALALNIARLHKLPGG